MPLRQAPAHDAVSEFILEHAREQAVADSIGAALRPFLQIWGGTSPYPLVTKAAVSRAKVMRAIGAVQGRRVRHIAFVSARKPLARPSFLGDDGYRQAVVTSLNALETSLEKKIWLHEHWVETWESSAGDSAESFSRLLGETSFCHAELKCRFPPEWWDGGLDKSFGDILWLSLADAVSCYVIASLLGRPEAKSFRALLAIMPQTIPIGFLKASPETAVCVVA